MTTTGFGIDVGGSGVKGGTIDLTTEGADDIGSPTNYFDIDPGVQWNLTMNGGTPYIACVGDCPLSLPDCPIASGPLIPRASPASAMLPKTFLV